jgi:hypothetical protein
MDRHLLFQDSFAVVLEPRESQLYLVFERMVGPGSETLASYPVAISLLRAVLKGFTYQVANEQGSLNIIKAADTIQISAQLTSREKFSAKISLEHFSTVLDSFGV